MPHGLFQTTGEICAKFGSDRFRNVDLYKVQTLIFIYKITLHYTYINTSITLFAQKHCDRLMYYRCISYYVHCTCFTQAYHVHLNTVH